MDTSPNLQLPYIQAAQAQKHVTHNEAIRALDAIVQLAVADRDLSAPPASPVEGARYIVAAGAAGAWAGHDLAIAAWQDGAWMVYAPQEGWMAWVADEDVAVAWNGNGWVPVSVGRAASFDTLGINATADATNRLAVSADASLLNHAGAGHQAKINKAAATDTASLLFQTAFSARAEMGTTGDDDFRFKVSPDGATFHEALVIDRTTGRVRFPAGGAREQLTLPRTYYVNPATGSDANDGLSSGAAFRTIQRAVSAAQSIDPLGNQVTIQLADGTYTAGAVIDRGMLDGQRLRIVGNNTTPGNVHINLGSGTGTGLSVTGGATIVQIEGLKVTANVGLWVRYGASALVRGAIEFGPCNARQMGCDNSGYIEAISTLNIAGGGSNSIQSNQNGHILVTGSTVNLIGTPAFTNAFVLAQQTGVASVYNNTYVGAATGVRYRATGNGVIWTNGASTTALPGDAAGVLATGGQYV